MNTPFIPLGANFPSFGSIFLNQKQQKDIPGRSFGHLKGADWTRMFSVTVKP